LALKNEAVVLLDVYRIEGTRLIMPFSWHNVLKLGYGVLPMLIIIMAMVVVVMEMPGCLMMITTTKAIMVRNMMLIIRRHTYCSAYLSQSRQKLFFPFGRWRDKFGWLIVSIATVEKLNT